MIKFLITLYTLSIFLGFMGCCQENSGNMQNSDSKDNSAHSSIVNVLEKHVTNVVQKSFDNSEMKEDFDKVRNFVADVADKVGDVVNTYNSINKTSKTVKKYCNSQNILKILPFTGNRKQENLSNKINDTSILAHSINSFSNIVHDDGNSALVIPSSVKPGLGSMRVFSGESAGAVCSLIDGVFGFSEKQKRKTQKEVQKTENIKLKQVQVLKEDTIQKRYNIKELGKQSRQTLKEKYNYQKQILNSDCNNKMLMLNKSAFYKKDVAKFENDEQRKTLQFLHDNKMHEISISTTQELQKERKLINLRKENNREYLLLKQLNNLNLSKDRFQKNLSLSKTDFQYKSQLLDKKYNKECSIVESKKKLEKQKYIHEMSKIYQKYYLENKLSQQQSNRDIEKIATEYEQKQALTQQNIDFEDKKMQYNRDTQKIKYAQDNMLEQQKYNYQKDLIETKYQKVKQIHDQKAIADDMLEQKKFERKLYFNNLDAVKTNLPSHNIIPFIYRNDILDTIKENLFCTQKNSIDSFIWHIPNKETSLYGWSGVGKSVLALTYSHSYFNDLYEMVWWIDAQNNETVFNSLRDIAWQLGSKTAYGTKVERDILNYIRLKISQQKHKWLIVWDNLDDINIYYKYNKTRFYPSIGGHILITSRNIKAPNKILVKTLSDNKAIELCLGIVSPQNEVEAFAMKHLATNVLHKLPLAIKEACTYIKDTAYSYKGYLSILQCYTKELDNEKECDMDYNRGITLGSSILFSINIPSMYEVNRENDVCDTRLLDFKNSLKWNQYSNIKNPETLSFIINALTILDYKAISREVMEVLPLNIIDLNRGISLLSKKGIIQIDNNGNFFVHPVMQNIVFNKLTAYQKCIIFNIIFNILKKCHDKTWPNEEVASHLYCFWNRLIKELWLINNKKDYKVNIEDEKVLSPELNKNRTIPSIDEVNRENRVYDTELLNPGNSFKWKRNLSKIDHQTQIADIAKKSLPYIESLGRYYIDNNINDAAIQVLTYAVSIIETTFTNKQPFLFAKIFNIYAKAIFLKNDHNVELALKYYKKATEVCDKYQHKQPFDIDTLQYHNDLANFLYHLKHYKEAKISFLRILDIQKKYPKLDKNKFALSSDIIEEECLFKLGIIALIEKNYDKSQIYFEKVLDLYKTNYTNFVYKKATNFILGNIYLKFGKLENALVYLKESINGAITYANIGFIYENIADKISTENNNLEQILINYELALDYLEKSWQISLNKTDEEDNEIFGSILDDFLGSRDNLWNVINRVYSKIVRYKNINKLSACVMRGSGVILQKMIFEYNRFNDIIGNKLIFSIVDSLFKETNMTSSLHYDIKNLISWYYGVYLDFIDSNDLPLLHGAKTKQSIFVLANNNAHLEIEDKNGKTAYQYHKKNDDGLDKVLATLGAKTWCLEDYMSSINEAGTDEFVIQKSNNTKNYIGHSKKINDIAFHTKRDMVATASYDNKVIVWNSEHNSIIETIKHPYCVNGISYNKSCNILATAAIDGIRLWGDRTSMPTSPPLSDERINSNKFTLSKSRKFKQRAFLKGKFQKIINISNIQFIMTACSTINLYDVNTNKIIKTLDTSNQINDIVNNEKKSVLVSAHDNGTIKMWDLRSDKPFIKTLKKGNFKINDIEYNNDCTTLVSASDSGKIWMWDTKFPHNVYRINGGEGYTTNISFSPRCNNVLASYNDDDNHIKFWDITTKKVIHELQIGQEVANLVIFNKKTNSLFYTQKNYLKECS